MNTHIDTAVLNNIIWCGIVSKTHGVGHHSKGHAWGLLSEAPPFYPDIITKSKYVTTQEVVDFIGDKHISSIKDSFSNLAMEPFGFKVLFDAEWIYHPPVSDSESVETVWRVITNEEDLSRWNFAHGSEGIIRPKLLIRDDVKVFINENQDKISGFIANLGANAVGISNVFSTMETTNENLWADIAKVVSTEFPNIHMVGYEQDGDLTSALTYGWESLGSLRIWIRSGCNITLKQ